MSAIAGDVAAGRAGAAWPPRARAHGAWLIFVLVATAQVAFGLWMASRGFRFGDAFYRSTSALFSVHSADPKLANIGFVWMPLPTLLNLPWVLTYPVFSDIVSSGAASALSSAVCGGASAAVLLSTAQRLGLSRSVGWTFALLVSLNPTVFLYAGSGMAEGVVAPFVIASLCFLTLFWYSGERWWIAAAGVALALGVGAAYQAIPYGAALFVALAAAVLWGTESRASAPLGRRYAVQALGLLLLVPSVFVGLLWIGANAVIMGDPLFFVNGAYGYASYQGAAFTSSSAPVEGDLIATADLLAPRTWPFLVPVIALLAVRLLDRRFLRVETALLVLLAFSVTVGLIVPMAYLGSRMDFLRYHYFPLFVAAGWGLYEIARSGRPRRAAALTLGGWALAIPACLVVMANPALAPQEYPQLRALVDGRDAQALGYGDPVVTRRPIADDLETRALGDDRRVLLDSYQGAAIAAQVEPDHVEQLVMTFDDRFRAALADPVSSRIAYVLVPDPAAWPQDVVNRMRPRLWAGDEPGFRLARAFEAGEGSDLPESWRLFAVEDDARILPAGRGGVG